MTRAGATLAAAAAAAAGMLTGSGGEKTTGVMMTRSAARTMTGAVIVGAAGAAGGMIEIGIVAAGAGAEAAAIATATGMLPPLDGFDLHSCFMWAHLCSGLRRTRLLYLSALTRPQICAQYVRTFASCTQN